MFQIEFAMHICKMKQLFKFIENLEHLIESSELNWGWRSCYNFDHLQISLPVFVGLKNPISKAIYMRSSEQVQKLSQTLTFALRDFTLPLMMGPVFLISFAKYFLNGLDNDAFQMPFITWYVFAYISLQAMVIQLRILEY